MQWRIFQLILFVRLTLAGEWKPWNQTNYYFSSSGSYWQKARDDCHTRNATLAVITSEDEQQFLTQNLRDGSQYWIGLRQGSWKCSCGTPGTLQCRRCRDSWRWYDDTPMGYQAWNGDEPQRSEYARMVAPSGRWAELGPNQNFNRICERPLCADKKCINGECEASAGVASCTCAHGFTGESCESDIDECGHTDFCQHESKCVNFPGSYNCSCTSGYRGFHCEHDIDECLELHPCSNNATCKNTIGDFDCLCQSGFTGRTCETDINEYMQANPCQHASTCVNTFGGYNCSCADGLSGKNCEIGNAKSIIDSMSTEGLVVSLVVGAILDVIFFIVMVITIVHYRRHTRNDMDETPKIATEGTQ